jgi:hypothetical protein
MELLLLHQYKLCGTNIFSCHGLIRDYRLEGTDATEMIPMSLQRIVSANWKYCAIDKDFRIIRTRARENY